MSHVDRDDIEVRELIVEHLEDELRFARSIADAVAKEMKLTVDEVSRRAPHRRPGPAPPEAGVATATLAASIAAAAANADAAAAAPSTASHTTRVYPCPTPFPLQSAQSVVEAIRAQAKKGAVARGGERYAVRIATVPKASATPGKAAETVMAGVVVVRTVKLRGIGEQQKPPAAAAAPGGAAGAAAAAGGAAAAAAAGGSALRGPIGFELLETVGADTMGAEVVALAVLRKYRRIGVAQKLLNEALQDVLRGAANVQVAFGFAPRGDPAAEDFYHTRFNFDEFGVVPNYRGSGADFVVWTQAFHNGTLATYAGEGDELPVFAAGGEAPKRKRHTPRWLVELGLQFGLPILIVVLLFGISYFLVWLGPLKGISSKFLKTHGGEGGEEAEM